MPERIGALVFASAFLTFVAICGFPAFVEDMRVFRHERLNRHYGVVAFVVGNTLSSIPFLFLIALSSGTLVYVAHGGVALWVWPLCLLHPPALCSLNLCAEPDDAISSVVG